MLQVTRSGQWHTLLRMKSAQREDMLQAARNLAGILGKQTQWSLLHDDGRRELLDFAKENAHACH